MLDSVKNDFSGDFVSKGLGVNGAVGTDATEADGTSFASVWQLGRNYTQGMPAQLPGQAEIEPTADFVSRSAMDLSSGDLSSGQLASSEPLSPPASAKQTVASNISQSLSKESAAWQGDLLGSPAQGTQKSISTSAALRSSPAKGLSQSQLNNATGTFVVGGSGKVTTDFLFDGDSRVGELALFNLAGMDGLDRTQFTKEAARRALSGGQNGRIVIKDKTQGAQFGGFLGEQSRSRGKAAGTQTVSLKAGTRFGVLYVPQGTVSEASVGKVPVQFSIAALNNGGKTQMGKVANDIFAMESSTFYKSFADFNDVVFRIKGARGSAPNVSGLLPANKNWLKNANQPFLKKSGSDSTPDPVDQPKKPNPTPAPIPQPQPNPNPPIGSPSLPGVTSDVSTRVSKFNPGSSEAEIIASGAQKIVLGSQRIYIGTQQVTSINQNPILRSFDSKNPKNNWTRTDIEVTGTDGRGSGLLWTGKNLYGVFSVDGTQGNASQDFRRATTGATQNWLKSYGPGGGGRISVIAQLDPATGKLLKAAHLSAVLSSGKTNSLAVTDATVNQAGNIVLKAQSFFNPRRPDGKAMTRNPGNNAGSPFDYTLEINKDLTKVLRTSAKGWS